MGSTASTEGLPPVDRRPRVDLVRSTPIPTMQATRGDQGILDTEVAFVGDASYIALNPAQLDKIRGTVKPEL